MTPATIAVFMAAVWFLGALNAWGPIAGQHQAMVDAQCNIVRASVFTAAFAAPFLIIAILALAALVWAMRARVAFPPLWV